MPDSRTKIISGSEAQMGEEWTWTDFSETLVSSHLVPFLWEFQMMIVLQNQTLRPLAAGSGLIQSKNGIIGKTKTPLQGHLRHPSAGAALYSEPPTHGSQYPCIAQDYLYVERKDLILHKGVFGMSSFLDKFPICFQAQFQYHLRKNSSVLIHSNITPFSSMFSWQFQHSFIIPLNHITRS